MIAALYVVTNGVYSGRPDVEVWDVARDARTYAGPHPVVAHPPCERWGRYWYGGPLLHKLGKRKVKGDDGGCFAHALAAVRRWGGVLEHPAASSAWRAFNILPPPHRGGWVPAGLLHEGAFTCHVEQGHYGHRARKATWLYCCGLEPPALTWGPSDKGLPPPAGSITPEERRRAQRLGVMSGGAAQGIERMGHRERLSTPAMFAELLITAAGRAGGR